MQNYKKKMYFCIFKQYFIKKDFTTMKIHPDTLSFFDELHENNNRDWFAENKSRWTDIQHVFLDFTQQLINIMTPLDPALGNLQPKQCVYRIYRDLRFSADKRPYKTHIACFLPAGGNRTQCVPGYYLQIGQGDYGLKGGCSLGGGIFMPSPKQLAAIRQEIYYCPDEFKGIMQEKAYRHYFGNEFYTSRKLTRPPKGYPADWSDIELLKYRDYCTMYEMPYDMILTEDFFDEVVKVWKATVPLNRFIERALTDVEA